MILVEWVLEGSTLPPPLLRYGSEVFTPPEAPTRKVPRSPSSSPHRPSSLSSPISNRAGVMSAWMDGCQNPHLQCPATPIPYIKLRPIRECKVPPAFALTLRLTSAIYIIRATPRSRATSLARIYCPRTMSHSPGPDTSQSAPRPSRPTIAGPTTATNGK
jgi:hypothetical protein